MKKFVLLNFLLLILVSCENGEKTQVLVLPTIHGAHETNENYTYGDLLELVKAYDPDVIGVEIRPEDFDMESDSLDLFYPLEMIMVRDSFPGMVRGIDYYSESTKNMRVSREMFSDTTSEMYRIKRIMQDMRLDSAFVAKYEATDLPKIQEKQREIALTYSAEELLKGEYDSITGRQYKIEDSLFNNSLYAAYPVFNNQRDLQITLKALELVEEYPGNKILILVGANHRNRLMDSLEKREVHVVNDLSFRSVQNHL
ncbi:hypothetical protein [Salinimicrobium xinjiangense]|uniref:hypothetical protein n=1 Tax=Salinimicrobium xinjiangense TaxID=438596 RepID=UPI000400D165|nr:hypothetical protein [Salinimicrobium xinjiangense]